MLSKIYQIVAGVFLCGIIVSLLTGCGYRFSGGGTLPGGVLKVYLNVLENRTGEVGVENTITNDLMNEFTRNNKEMLASSMATADAILSGVVTSMSTSNVSRTASQTAVQRRVTVRIQLKMHKTGDESQMLWSDNNISAEEVYDATGESLSTGTARQNAILKVSKRLAEDAYERMTIDF